MSKVTPKTFRDPLLKSLGTLSGLKVGEPVVSEDAITRVLADMGMDEAELGDDPNGRPRTRILINQTFHRLIKKHGLGDSPRRGQWTLSTEGVQTAALLLGQSVPAVDADGDGSTPESPAVDDDGATPDPTTILASSGVGGAGVVFTFGEQINTYNPDPYIRGLAIAATNCSGFWSARSDVCKSCPLSGACKAEASSRLSIIAGRLDREDEEARKRALAPKSQKAKDETESKAKADDMDIDDILAAIEGGDKKTSIPAHSNMKVPADAKCAHCGGSVRRGDDGYWVRTGGMFHPKCFEEKYGK
jgi:hypothetical protein